LGIRDRLAALVDHPLDQLARVRGHPGADLAADGGALVRAERTRGRQRGVGGGDGAVELARSAERDAGERPPVEGRFQLTGFGGLDELPGDVGGKVHAAEDTPRKGYFTTISPFMLGWMWQRKLKVPAELKVCVYVLAPLASSGPPS